MLFVPAALAGLLFFFSAKKRGLNPGVWMLVGMLGYFAGIFVGFLVAWVFGLRATAETIPTIFLTVLIVILILYWPVMDHFEDRLKKKN